MSRTDITSASQTKPSPESVTRAATTQLIRSPSSAPELLLVTPPPGTNERR